MADNYIERRREEIAARKVAEQRAKQVAWKKRLDVYRKQKEELERKTWIAVLNPHAGSGKTLSIWQKAETLLNSKGVIYQCERAGGKFNVSELTFNAACKGFRKFIAVGGDGTVHDVLEGVMRYLTEMGKSLQGETPRYSLSDFALAVIPIGSGNDWIKVHGIPRDLETVVDLISSENLGKQDVVKVSFPSSDVSPSYMINVGGVGLDAKICARVNRKKANGESGKLLYVKALIYTLLHHKSFAVRVECDGVTVHEGPVLSIAFGVGKFSGGGLRQTPEAVPDDGLLDMTLIPPVPVLRIVSQIYKLLTSKFLTIKGLKFGKYRKVIVSSLVHGTEPVEVDGEVPGNLPIVLEVLPDQLNVLHGRVSPCLLQKNTAKKVD